MEDIHGQQQERRGTDWGSAATVRACASGEPAGETAAAARLDAESTVAVRISEPAIERIGLLLLRIRAAVG